MDAARQEARIARRRALVPAITYPDLPVTARRDDIAAAIRDHQVVVIAGETGSGKTTQIPKICLELGRGLAGTIGHTQPRRIAARSVAERIAEELDVELGSAIGYQVRFTDQSSCDTLVKVMTDGILLAELQRDRELRRYDTIIIDEAHERSLNIDFILGYLKQLLPRRPDLKVIITSATIDPRRFADHFATEGNPVPIVEVSGRTYPVEVRYRPLAADPDSGGGEGGDEDDDPTPAGQGEDRDQVTGICDAVMELWTERREGDILVFLSGEREIRDAAEGLATLDLPQTEILPLFGRLSAAEQHRVFSRHGAGMSRRVVLATNVAETSLTVPGVRYVVDTGTARISRFNQRTKVQRLPIEPISRASANQRAGRCGRVADGICIRLYSEDDHLSRPEFTDPEILRTNLASVILQMTSLGLGDVARFPFVDPPDSRSIADGVRLLEELRAFEVEDEAATPAGGSPRRRLTAYGRTIALLPIDPRLARMVIEADRLGCLREVLVIVAAMSIQDPRERPLEKKELAAAAHKRFAVENSDFGSYLALWSYLKEQQKALSGSAFRRMCKSEYLHFLRIREWQDLHQQLRQAGKQAGLDTSVGTGEEPDLDTVHRALLSGLLSQVGSRDEVRRDYLGARGARFGISPGSTLVRKQPQFVMAGELVETSRLWARVVARIDPLWAEELGAHLVKRAYSEPRWSGRQGSAVATERVTLFGVPIVVARTVGYAVVDPALARQLFIQRALVERDWTTRHRFFRDNVALVERLSELEARTRRRDILVDDETLVAFYDERIPAEVVSATHFDTWWKKESRRHPDLLTFTEELLIRDSAGPVDRDAYPSTWPVAPGDPEAVEPDAVDPDAVELAVTYQFEPGLADDGVTVHVPVEVLNRVTAGGFDWQVPGLREDLVTALIRTLPKVTRRLLVPAPEHASATVRALHERGLGPGNGPLTSVLRHLLRETHGVVIGPDDFDLTRIPDHLRVTFSVEDHRGQAIARGPDLDALRETAAPQLRRRVAQAGQALERQGVRDWSVGTIPVEVSNPSAGGRSVRGFPALVETGDAVALRVLPTRAEAEAEHRVGVRRLLILGTTPPWKQVLSRLTNTQKLALGHNPHGSVPALLEDCLACAVDSLAAEHVPHEVRSPDDFAAALAAVRAHAGARVVQVVALVEPVLAKHLRAVRLLDSLTGPTGTPALRDLVSDVRAQLAELIRPGFVAETGFARLPDLDRYLRAILHRLERAPADLTRDATSMAEVLTVEQSYAGLLDALRPARRAGEDVVAVAWMIEELRVSLFAQRLGTAYPVSVKRIQRAIDAVVRG